jgi:soluble lytic murein transglycosylase-like protein
LALLSSTRNRAIALSAAGTVVILVLVAAVVGLRGLGHTSAANPLVAGSASDSASASASAVPSDLPSDPPSPTPSPTGAPSPTPAARKATVKAVPSHAKVALPPPAGPPAANCPVTHSGTAASKATVAAALTSAAGVAYHPSIASVPSQTITLDVKVLEAVAWQESGWQSNVVSCDNAYGVMQLLSPTATWMNGNYGTSHDMHTAAGNVALGGEYLAWLVYYFGHFCFGDHYDMTKTDPNVPVLRDAVFSAYYSGVGNVDTGGGLVIAHRDYVNAVEGLLDNPTPPWA